MALVCELGKNKESTRVPNFIRIRSFYGFLDIFFCRTIRVADNKEAMFLPPHLGLYPLHSVAEYPSLPSSIKDKGGLFFPVHDMEAMSISFRSDAPFAIRVSVGGINVLTGESSEVANGWMEVDGQAWLDGFAVARARDGLAVYALVRQFVATHAGSNASYEAQKTGHESDQTIRLEIMPRFPNFIQKWEDTLPISVKTTVGRTIELWVHRNNTVLQVKEMLTDRDGSPVKLQRLLFHGKELENSSTLADENIQRDSTLHQFLRLRGGFRPPILNPENLHIMTVAPGGLIRQRNYHAPKPKDLWDHENIISFKINLFASSHYQKITNLPPAHPPMSEAEYSALNLPYFLNEGDLASQLNIPGSPDDRDPALGDAVRSICDIRGLNESSHQIAVVPLDQTGPGAMANREISPFAEMLARARRLNHDATVAKGSVVEWWKKSSTDELGPDAAEVKVFSDAKVSTTVQPEGLDSTAGAKRWRSKLQSGKRRRFKSICVIL